MYKRIWLSWKLVLGSVRLLRTEPDLLLFPIVSISVTVLVLATLAVALLASAGFDWAVIVERSYFANLFVLFAFYLVAYFIIFFVNTGLAGAVMLLLDGEHPHIAGCFQIARQRVGSIFGYALIMATIGLFLRWLFKLTGPPGRLVGPFLKRFLVFSFVGLAWNLIPYLVVPILVMENVGPLAAFRRSTGLIKKTWGENVVGNASSTVIFVLLVLLVVAAGSPAIQWAILTGRPWIMIGVIYLFAMLLLTLFLIKLVLDGIFCAVVYRLATDRSLGGDFDRQLVQQVFRVKRSRRNRHPAIPKKGEAAGPTADAVAVEETNG